MSSQLAQAAGGDDDIGRLRASSTLPGPLGLSPTRCAKTLSDPADSPWEIIERRVGDAAPLRSVPTDRISTLCDTKRPPQSDAADIPAACGKRKQREAAGNGPPAGASGWDRRALQVDLARSMPSIAAWTMASMSRACSAPHLAGMGRRRGWRGEHGAQSYRGGWRSQRCRFSGRSNISSLSFPMQGRRMGSSPHSGDQHGVHGLACHCPDTAVTGLGPHACHAWKCAHNAAHDDGDSSSGQERRSSSEWR